MTKPLPVTGTSPSDADTKDAHVVVDGQEVGLTDDQRVRREEDAPGTGARVKPGPADEERS